jgi:hypothetical protein
MKVIAYRAPLLDRVAGLRMAAIILACAIGAWLATDAARARMAREHHRRAICQARLEAVIARNIFVERYVRPADPCLALELAAR